LGLGCGIASAIEHLISLALGIGPSLGVGALAPVGVLGLRIFGVSRDVWSEFQPAVVLGAATTSLGALQSWGLLAFVPWGWAQGLVRVPVGLGSG
jgi:hypothetical protein